MLITWARHCAEAPNILYVKVFEQKANVTKFLILCKVEQTYISPASAGRYVSCVCARNV
jgi:hypothetical protein